MRRALVFAGVALGAALLWLASALLTEPAARTTAPAPAQPSIRSLEPELAPDAAVSEAPAAEAPSAPASARAVPARPKGELAQREYTVQLDELTTFCWGDPQNPSHRYADEPLELFALRIPTNTNASVPFDFCVRELRFGAAAMRWGKAGRVEASSNALKLEGEWLTFSDPVTQWERPARVGPLLDALQPGEPLCIKGNAPQVFQGHYGDYWGAAVGFQFRRQDAARTAAYRPHFSSVSIVLEGAVIPNTLVLAVDRRPFREGNESWCKFLR